MKRVFFAGLAVLSMAALTACGGGGSDGGGAPADAIDKYVGTWSNCFASGGASARVTAQFTKTSATTGNYRLTANGYASSNCTGTSPAAASSTETGTAVLQGTKTIGAETVDKATFTSSTESAQKQVVVIRGQQLLLGVPAEDGPVDAEGYPNTLDSGFPLLKQ